MKNKKDEKKDLNSIFIDMKNLFNDFDKDTKDLIKKLKKQYEKDMESNKTRKKMEYNKREI